MKFIANLFKKKPQTVENILIYPEGKRYYKDSHIIRKNLIDEDALKIMHRLTKFNHKAFLVGGGVRDILLGKKPKDFDIATSATPNQIKNIFNNCRIIGKRFKIVHVMFKGKIIEVSTFRSLPDHRLGKQTEDKDYLLRRDNNYGTAKEDAARRDFTINSLYYDPRNDSIIDFVGGFDDIKNKVLKVIGDPDVSFKEDPVRMLRAVKFQMLHGLNLDKETKAGIKRNRLELEKASSSRMLEEYNKIFRTWRTSEIFQGLAENHLLDVLFKEALDVSKKNPNWQKDFLDSNIGKRLVIADRMLQEREELTSVIFFSLIFCDLINDAFEKDKNKQNMVHSIKTAIEPICNRMEIPKKDKERLIKIFASQKRFFKTEENNPTHNEVFRKKDFFYEAFMFFKINALAVKDEQAIQSAFFWEISTRNRPKPSQRMIHNEAGAGERERFRSFRNDRKPKRFSKPNHNHKDSNPSHSASKVEKAEKMEEKNYPKEQEEKKIPVAKSAEIPAEGANPPKDGKPFKRNKYRNRFRKYGNRPKKTQGDAKSSGENSGNSGVQAETSS
ncbi:MAG: polynucleotide adenylyltransferase PcnB [Leptospiraceae bacterium]|nr:polynucleotide adenylyltransferase PcnB [Leptospiraceae bacterium]